VEQKCLRLEARIKMPLYEVYLDRNDGYAPKIVATVNADNKEDAKTRAIEQVRVSSGYNREVIARLYPTNKLKVLSV
jgi:hypothetical protein